MKDIFGVLITVVTIYVIFCGLLARCAHEGKIVYIKKISGYDLVELEDGHQYLKPDRLYSRSHSLEHYIDCPKCKNK